MENLVLDEMVKNEKLFEEQTEEELRYSTDQIILKCSSMTGCEAPTVEFFAKNISDALVSFLLKFGYEKYSLPEILFSIEMNATHRFKLPSGLDFDQVDFTGKMVNVNFIAKCLNNYAIVRALLIRKMENLIDGI